MAEIQVSVLKRVARLDDARIALEVHVEAFGMTPCVFAIERIPTGRPDDPATYRFSHVCTSDMLLRYGETPEIGVPYHRESCIRLILPNEERAEHDYRVIEDGIRRLVAEMRAMDGLKWSESRVTI